jgi:tellurite resistance protein
MVWNKLTGRGASPEQKAYLEAMLILAMADGELEDEEIDDMAVSCARHPKLSELGDRTIISVLNESYRKMLNQGNDRRIREMAKVLQSTEQRMDAVGVALSISMSDGTIEPEELAILKQMQSVFELSDEQIEQVMSQYQ